MLKKMLITACWLSTSALALPWPSSITEHSLAEIVPEPAMKIADHLIQWGESIADTIGTLSGQENCDSLNGTYEDMKWTWRSSDQKCNLKDHRATLDYVIKEYVARRKDLGRCEDCDTQCLQIYAPGAWGGWVKLGPIGGFNEQAYCGPSLGPVSSLGDVHDNLSEERVL